ncbi:LLM class F420-dependent oxidoreductase [Phytohabitans suffuscus]|uniref:LLM class F420-dependent oxidoreductase n=1 Tax=Phytohabitans suffuscus TaxID=624315 RepID=A0A6F8YCJ1_9ACTN|nr:LLM class F420-dependent oxidoreductase [Phytohabitans suffuscus]BCB83780.1 LLM class F420-dependent oxidoreductase [Phytohabitans suffuscus]
MRIGVPLSYSGGFREAARSVADFEAAGVDVVFVPEAYSFDAVSLLGFLAASTKRMTIASSILNVYSRTPALIAMTAAGLDHVSAGRFMLGIGASGPQVVEGFHGVPYRAPLGRAREVARICRAVWRRETLTFDGDHFHLPLGSDHGGSGLGKALKLINRPERTRIPIMLGAIGDRSVAVAAAEFEAWQPMFFLPEAADRVFGPSLREGAARRDPELGPLDVVAQSYLAVVRDEKERQAALRRVREHLALYIGGMGARSRNFYTTLISRFGFADAASLVQDLYLAGDRDTAAAAVPEALVQGLSLVGGEEEVRERLGAFAAAGVSTLALRPVTEEHGRRVRDFAFVREHCG